MTVSTHDVHRAELDHNGYRLLVGMLIYAGLQTAALLIAAGTARWAAAWAYFAVYLICMAIVMAWVARVNPAVMNERGRRPDNTEAFDRRFQRLVPIIIFGALIVGGIDHRFGWSAVPLGLQVAGFGLLVLALLIAGWVLATNAYAARVVRLQDEQRVVTGGPYRFVRHPMYSGTLLAWVATALALGSWWMLIPAASGIVLFVWRTWREDAFLHEKLAGYDDYATRTRYRLLPGLW